MSHELRTPLHAVIGFSDVLHGQAYGPLNDKQHEYMGYVISSSKHLLTLINEILDLSKVESGKMEISLMNCSLRELLTASVATIKGFALKDHIDLQLELAPTADVRIMVDQIKLTQIVFNLLSNAIKFTKTGGSVKVSVTRDTDFIEISVEDSGVGIKKEDFAKLFQTFTQLESPYRKEFAGTGLGLALTRQLVELHGGKIWVESEFGVGSRFTFTIPASQVVTKNGIEDASRSLSHPPLSLSLPESVNRISGTVVG